jgi:hypothetical protein
MKKVICINDSKQPEGGELIKDNEYEIEREFINDYDQKTYVISGINNFGITKMGMKWYGYNANRFSIADSTKSIFKIIEEEVVKEEEVLI